MFTKRPTAVRLYMAGNYFRELYSVSEKQQAMLKEQQHQQLWKHIYDASKTDPVLKNMLDQIEVYYSLKNTP